MLRRKHEGPRSLHQMLVRFLVYHRATTKAQLLKTGRSKEKEVDVVLGEVAGSNLNERPGSFQKEKDRPRSLCKVCATNQRATSQSWTFGRKEGGRCAWRRSWFRRKPEGPRSLRQMLVRLLA